MPLILILLIIAYLFIGKKKKPSLKAMSTEIRGIMDRKLGDRFSKRLATVSAKTGIPFDSLMKIIFLESNFNPQAKNASGATGLIQFMPATAKNLGTSSEELLKMSAEEQLTYVEKYLLSVKGNKEIKSFLDAYLLVFYPYAIGKPDSYVFGSEKSPEYAKKVGIQNKINKGEPFTKLQFKNFIDNRLKNYV